VFQREKIMAFVMMQFSVLKDTDTAAPLKLPD